MNWHETTLGEICEKDQGLVQTGPFGSQLHQSDYKETGVPVVMPKDIKDDKISTDSIARISIEDVQRLKRHNLKIGDIIFPRRGEINKRAIITKKEQGWVCGTGCLKISVGGKVAAPDYLYYYLGQRDVVKWIENQAIGATMANLNTSILKSVPVNLPPLPTQRKIAAILSAYDELIENNNRRIALLEQMAEEVYKEWFVRMRFPGWREKPFVEGVPEGWKEIRVGNAFKIRGGGTPSRDDEDYWDNGNINWFTPSDITRANGFFLPESSTKTNERGVRNSSTKMFPPYSVMLTSRATIGAVGINTTPACTNQGFITCIPNPMFPYPYILNWILEHKPLIEIVASGATFKEISRSVFKKLKILAPQQEVSEKYMKTVEPLYIQMELLQKKNQLLQETRDLLLPRLVSGKLGVKKLSNDLPREDKLASYP